MTKKREKPAAFAQNAEPLRIVSLHLLPSFKVSLHSFGIPPTPASSPPCYFQPPVREIQFTSRAINSQAYIDLHARAIVLKRGVSTSMGCREVSIFVCILKEISSSSFLFKKIKIYICCFPKLSGKSFQKYFSLAGPTLGFASVVNIFKAIFAVAVTTVIWRISTWKITGGAGGGG